jgi:hypothetical protein
MPLSSGCLRLPKDFEDVAYERWPIAKEPNAMVRP